LRSAYDGGSQVSTQFLYRFPSEADASEAFGLLVRQLQEEVPEAGWRISFRIARIDGGASPVLLNLLSPEDRHHELTQERAMREAWRMLIEARVEPPGMAFGNLIGSVEAAALIYAIEHMLPPGVAQAAREALKAAGVKVPDPGTLVAQGAEVYAMAWALALWKSVRQGLIVLGLGVAAAIVDYISGAEVTAWIKAHLGVAAMAVTPTLIGLSELARQWIKAYRGKYTTP
jgi:hypothetical protein